MKKNKKENAVSFREAMRLTGRSLRLWHKVRPRLMPSTILRALLEGVQPYVAVYFSARLIDELAGLRRSEELTRLALLTVILTALMALITALARRWNESSAEWEMLYHADESILARKALDMDFAVLDEQHTGDLYAQITQVRNWSSFGMITTWRASVKIIQSLSSILGALALSAGLFLQPVTNSAMLFLNHPLSAAAAVAVMGALTVIAPMLQTRGQQFIVGLAEESKLGNRLFGHFGWGPYDAGRALDMRLYRQIDICNNYMSQESTFGAKSGYARISRGIMGAYYAASGGLSALFTGVAYLFVCLKAWAGAFGVGAVTQYVGAITALSRGVSELVNGMGELVNNGAFLKNNFEYLDLPNPMYQGSLTTEKRSDREYEVELRDVSFKYPGSDQWALRHVSLKFRIGQRLAVVGMNGSGKTTFIKLLCRLYDPDEGEILLNGINIRKYNYKDYMNIFSVVFQDFQLLALTLGENVAAGSEIDRARAEKCLRDAGFGERLSTLPKGLDTHLYRTLDKEGVEVSGGEAQKIALARALYKDAPFIILDEPTAALDPIAEYEIYTRFNDLVGDKTAIYISHRLSSCRFCDEIAVFDGGQIVQLGNHDALVADENGKYYELWNAQAQYYTEKERTELIR